MAWGPSQPIDNIFTAIDRLSDAAYRAGSEYSASQKNNMAQVILTRTGAFRTGLRNWLHLSIPMRTWEAFKTLFRTEQGLLEAVHEGTFQDSRIQQANLVQQVVDGVQSMLINTEPEPTNAPAPREEPSVHNPAPMVHSMNAVHNNELLPSLMSQMAQMQSMMLTLQQQIQQQNTSQNQPPNPNSRTRRQRKYCWTHGGCGHSSSACKNKAQGHIDSATFQNKQGGSERGCNPQQG